MIDSIDLQKERMDDVVADQFEIRMRKEVPYIIFGAREEIIDADDIRSLF
jgi:hypothetical protein